MVPAKDWCSGFFAGELWMMYELSGDKYWREKAQEYTLSLDHEKWNARTHDMGFKIYNSFGKAWEQTHKPQYRKVLIQGAKTLTTRIKPHIGCIRSWDHNADRWGYPVVISSMMNLELLFWAAKETGNEMYKDVAIRHAERTMENHYQADYAAYDVVDYDPISGKVNAMYTQQAFNESSAWSRGQAWGLYGFTCVYRETGEEKFLKQAENIANFILTHPNNPENLIPYWDLDAPNIPNEPLDASAAAITASALFELSTLSEYGEVYVNAANTIIKSLLGTEFFSAPEDNYGFLLKHSTGSKIRNTEVDVPLIFADYYLIEAIMRKTNLINH